MRAEGSRAASIAEGNTGMNAAVDTVFLFDVDNTLLDNDRIREDLRARLQTAHGARASERYWEIMEELWATLGYMDYLGALERLRLEARYDRDPPPLNWSTLKYV